jgi:rod shape-determining protein MreC
VSTQPNSSLHRRRILVRRTVLIALVVLSLGLFTAYFREGGSGALHSVQDAAGAVVAPVQSVAKGAVEPFQDAWGWLTGLVDARGERSRLEQENAALRERVLALSDQTDEIARLRAQARLFDDPVSGYKPVSAAIVGRSPTSWYSRARLSVGTDDGVVVNSPVVAGRRRGAALVGVITAATAGSSTVSFITDGQTRVGAFVEGSGGGLGILEATTAGQLRLAGVPREFKVQDGAVVRTAGFKADMRLPSIYPRGIPVGQVVGAGARPVDVQQTIQVTPYVDVRTLTSVAVLAPVSVAARRRAAGP